MPIPTVLQTSTLIETIVQQSFSINILFETSSSGVIIPPVITRGLSFNIDMTNYSAGPSVSHVQVWIKDILGNQREYPCIVTLNTDSLVTATATDSGTLGFPLLGATVIVRPVISL